MTTKKRELMERGARMLDWTHGRPLPMLPETENARWRIATALDLGKAPRLSDIRWLEL